MMLALVLNMSVMLAGCHRPKRVVSGRQYQAFQKNDGLESSDNASALGAMLIKIASKSLQHF